MFVIERTITTPRGKKYSSFIKSRMLNTFALTYSQRDAKKYSSAEEAKKDAAAYRRHTQFSIPESLRVVELA